MFGEAERGVSRLRRQEALEHDESPLGSTPDRP